MADFVLDVKAGGRVSCVMRLKDGDLVQQTIPVRNALMMLEGKEVRETGEVYGHPLTGDGLFYFAGNAKDGGKPEPDAAKKRRGRAKAGGNDV